MFTHYNLNNRKVRDQGQGEVKDTVQFAKQEKVFQTLAVEKNGTRV
jgi:hypothetical protein